jgi:hypothetical protein
MSTGSGSAFRQGRRAALAALTVLAAASLAACGSKDFPNDPRQPEPLDVSAKVDSHEVQVSPPKFGSGLVTFTVANLSDSPIRFTLSGPKDVTSASIQPGSPGYLNVKLPQGDYQVTGGQGAKAKPAKIVVGPERPSSQNKLLLP